MGGVRDASELVNSSRKEVDEAVLMRKQHVKDQNELEKKTKKYHRKHVLDYEEIKEISFIFY